MIAAIRADWIKLRTVTMHWVLVIIAMAFPFVVSVINAAVRGDDFDFDTRALLEVVVGTAIVSSLLLSVLGAVAVTGEFGFGTIRPTLAAIPHRTRVAASKAIVIVGVAVVVQTVTVVVTWLVASTIAEGKGATVSLADSPLGSAPLVGAVVLAALMSLAGLGVGLIIRSTPGAVTALVLWPLMVEALVGALIAQITDNQTVVDWFPYRAGFRLTNIDEFHFGGPTRISGGVVFGCFALALFVVGTVSLQRRDA